MIILGGLIAIILLGVIAAEESPYDDALCFLGQLAAILAGAALFMAIVMIPLSRMSVYSEISEIQAMRATAEQSRADGHTLEGAAWRVKEAQVNADIASYRYYRGTVFSLWIPEAIDHIQPLQ